MGNKLLLNIISNVDRQLFNFRNIAFFGGFIYLLFVFHENPILIGILMALDIYVLTTLSYDQIKVYEDRIEIIDKGLLKVNTSVKEIEFGNIHSIDTNIKLRGKSGALTVLIGAFTPSLGLLAWNEFTINFKDGKTRGYITRIEETDLVRIFQLVRKLTEYKVKITGLDF